MRTEQLEMEQGPLRLLQVKELHADVTGFHQPVAVVVPLLAGEEEY
jgi:hypothetical protein